MPISCSGCVIVIDVAFFHIFLLFFNKIVGNVGPVHLLLVQFLNLDFHLDLTPAILLANRLQFQLEPSYNRLILLLQRNHLLISDKARYCSFLPFLGTGTGG